MTVSLKDAVSYFTSITCTLPVVLTKVSVRNKVSASPGNIGNIIVDRNVKSAPHCKLL